MKNELQEIMEKRITYPYKEKREALGLRYCEIAYLLKKRDKGTLATRVRISKSEKYAAGRKKGSHQPISWTNAEVMRIMMDFYDVNPPTEEERQELIEKGFIGRWTRGGETILPENLAHYKYREIRFSLGKHVSDIAKKIKVKNCRLSYVDRWNSAAEAPLRVGPEILAVAEGLYNYLEEEKARVAGKNLPPAPAEAPPLPFCAEKDIREVDKVDPRDMATILARDIVASMNYEKISEAIFAKMSNSPNFSSTSIADNITAKLNYSTIIAGLRALRVPTDDYAYVSFGQNMKINLQSMARSKKGLPSWEVSVPHGSTEDFVTFLKMAGALIRPAPEKK